MAKTTLLGCRVAILATDGFEEDELFKPKEALEDAGADVRVISLKSGNIKAWKKDKWGHSLKVDSTLDQVSADDFDALMLPGGVMNPDTLRMDAKAVQFVAAFAADRKPIAAICHGPWMLVEAGIVDGRNVTSWPSVRTDLLNAGAIWSDAEVIVDKGLITSRKPDDIPAFNAKMIEEFAEGPYESAQAQPANEERPTFHH